jgi:uncharacterized DUF497 family protein
MEFRWHPWNIGKCEKHGVAPEDAEYVVRHARRPFPRLIDDDKSMVWGQSPAGLYLQVIYVIDPEGTVFVIHARPLDESEKRQLRRKRR